MAGSSKDQEPTGPEPSVPVAVAVPPPAETHGANYHPATMTENVSQDQATPTPQPTSILPTSITAREINIQNEKYWSQWK